VLALALADAASVPANLAIASAIAFAMALQRGKGWRSAVVRAAVMFTLHCKAHAHITYRVCWKHEPGSGQYFACRGAVQSMDVLAWRV
jgi:hypothetical protein